MFKNIVMQENSEAGSAKMIMIETQELVVSKSVRQHICGVKWTEKATKPIIKYVELKK